VWLVVWRLLQGEGAGTRVPHEYVKLVALAIASQARDVRLRLVRCVGVGSKALHLLHLLHLRTAQGVSVNGQAHTSGREHAVDIARVRHRQQRARGGALMRPPLPLTDTAHIAPRRPRAWWRGGACLVVCLRPRPLELQVGVPSPGSGSCLELPWPLARAACARDATWHRSGGEQCPEALHLRLPLGQRGLQLVHIDATLVTRTLSPPAPSQVFAV